MGKITIVDLNANDKDQVKAYMVKGEPGANGVSPTINSSRTGSVTTVTVTDAEGTKAFDVNDGQPGATSNIIDSATLTNPATQTYSGRIIDEKIKNIYSTTENVVGEWIDDKPIYRKIINVTDLTPDTDDTKTIPHGISNMDKVVNIKCIANNTTDTFFDFNNYTWSIEGTWNTLHTFIDNTNIYVIYDGAGYINFVNDVYFILEYTKTTD